MEKLFSARWWDYSHEKYNLNGRICLKNSLLFGVLGFFLIYIVNPIVESFINLLSPFLLKLITSILLTIFIIDFILSFLLISKLHFKIKNIQNDATEEVDQEVRKLLAHYRLLYRRLLKAFPRIHFTTKSGNAFIRGIKRTLKDADTFLRNKKKDIKEAKQKVKELKEEEQDKEIIKEQKAILKEIKKRRFPG